MNSEQITAMIDSMTDAEIGFLESALSRRRAAGAAVIRDEPADNAPAVSRAGRKMTSAEAMDYVFENFDDLLYRLAQ